MPWQPWLDGRGLKKKKKKNRGIGRIRIQTNPSFCQRQGSETTKGQRVCLCERASCEQVFALSQGAGLLIIMEVMVRRGIRGNFPND